MAMHVSFGGEGEYERLPEYASQHGKPLWTLAKDARKDDTVVFYIKSPLASFVATGRVLDDRREDGTPHGYPGQKMGLIGDIAMLPKEIRLRGARDATPGWGWLRQPHTNITVPTEHEKAFWASLGLSSSAPKPPGRTPPGSTQDPGKMAAENMRRESTVLGRSRNRALRDAVIKASNGDCAACGVNYQKIEPRRWTSLLQAHHKKPLHELKEVTVNGVTDLVALCPTCHVLTHLGKSGVRTAAHVRALYKRA
jgi:hypothetical protein